jgi:hypothetical protein
MNENTADQKWTDYDAARVATLHAIGEKLRAARTRQEATQDVAAKARSTLLDPFASPKAKQTAHADQIEASAAFTRIAGELRVLSAEEQSALRGDHPTLGAARLRAQHAETARKADASNAAEAALRAAMRSDEVQAAVNALAAQQGRQKALQLASEFLAA